MICFLVSETSSLQWQRAELRSDRLPGRSDGLEDADDRLRVESLPNTVIPLSPQTSDEPWL